MQWTQTPSVTTGKNSLSHSQAMRAVKDALGPVPVIWGWHICTFACMVTTPCTHPHGRTFENKIWRSWGTCICVSGVDILCLHISAFSHGRKGCRKAACSATGSRLDGTLAALSLLVAPRASLTPLLCLNFLHSSCLYMKLYYAFILLIPLSFVSWTKAVSPEGKHCYNRHTVAYSRC